MTLLADARLLAAAQLRTELRGRAAIAASATVGALGLILVGLVAGPDLARLRDLGPGLVWLGLLYAVIALADRLDATLHTQEAHSAFWLVVADRRAIYLGTVAALTALLLGLVLALAMLATILLGLRLPSAGLPLLVVACAIGALAASAVAVLVSALVRASVQRVLLAPVILLPLLAPTLLAGSGALRALVASESSALVGWLALLTAQAALFLGLGLLTYEAAATPE